jgi:tetratricopeptide (TPR) repeat protein
MGTAKHSKKMYLEAIEDFEQAFDFFKKEKNRFHESSCYYMLASCYHKLNLDDKASLYLKRSLEIDKTVNNELRTLEGLTLKGSIVLKNDVEAALDIGLSVLEKINDGTPQDIRKGAFELLYRCFQELGDYKKSLKMHELYLASSDNMRIEETNFATIREAVKYEFEIELVETQLENQEAQAALKLSQVKKNFWIISVSVVVILSLLFFFRSKSIKMRKKREELLVELEELKSAKSSNLAMDTQAFALNREKVESSINRKLNETDWKVLQILLDDPMITNKEIAAKAFLSDDGIGSSLRRMYEYFEVKETKYKKIALLMNAIKRSKEQ